LVTALEPVLRNRGGVWIGWSGLTEPVDLEKLLEREKFPIGYKLMPITLSETERDYFYYGYANEIVWPLFHDLQSLCRFNPQYIKAYLDVNERFARMIKENCTPDDFIWVHDYHLMHVAHFLAEMGARMHVAFFLHIPFPSLDIFLKLPDRHKLLRALLDYDLIGFQTSRDRRNFVQCVRRLLKDVKVRQEGGMHVVHIGEREVRVGTFPIGIDFNEFATQAASEEVARRAWNIHAGLPNRQLLLGVDRLDYTKGIPDRLEAFRTALARFPELHRNITFIQVVVPSRTAVSRYHELKLEIERLVGEINGQFTEGGWVPIHFLFRSLERAELLAYYRTCEIAIITPLKDGMNLVSKEYCASSLEENGVLILSEFAGSASQLRRGAILVNPFDAGETAEAIHRACKMTQEERAWRMKRMRRNVRMQDIYWWVDSFISAAFALDLEAFPVIEDYVPAEDRAEEA
jgi:trehalose 6-phosphate synthase